MPKFTTTNILPERLTTDALVLFLFEDSKDDSAYTSIDKKLGGRISSLIKKKSYKASKSSIRTIDTLGRLKSDSVILVGLGKKKEFTAEILRRASAKMAKSAALCKVVQSIGFSIDSLIEKETDVLELAGAIADGIILSQYSFTHYKKKPADKEKDKKKITTVTISAKNKETDIKKGIAIAEKVAKGVFIARDLQNHPGNIATPTYIASQAVKFCRKAGIRCKVLGRKEIERLKMGSFLAVAKGSIQEPKFLVMEYKKGAKNGKPTVLVGKGLTFDTGGISIKPSAGMEGMKFDMSGGAAVIGTMIATANLKLKKNVIGLVPLTENMPGGRACKPGDIIKASDGQTIEVLNTDAEGRLILADALVYAQKYNPAKVIDLATLTGAIMVSLGSYATGLFTNDQKLADSVLDSGERTGERCWQFPLWEEYEKLIDSKIADMQNIGGRYGGSITAAAFLKKFTKYPWVHLDIAGTADNATPTAPYNSVGGTGIGVRLLTDFLRKK